MTTAMHCRTAFISDVHLGTGACKADYLLSFLRALRADTLYLVGDIVDLERMRRSTHWAPEHSAVVAELFRLARRGTRVVYIPGNHDAPLRRFAGQIVDGVEVRLRAEHLCADGRRLLVSHGDEFDAELSAGALIGLLGDLGYRALSRLNHILNHRRARRGKHYWPMAVMLKSRFRRARHFIDRFERRAVQAAQEGGYDGYLGGHIHFAGIRQEGAVVYANCGDWTDHCTALTEDHSGKLHLLHWSDQVGRVEDEAWLRAAPAPLTPKTCFQLTPHTAGPEHAAIERRAA